MKRFWSRLPGLVLVVSCTEFINGCLSKSSTEMYSYAIVRGMAGDASEIPFWTEAFESDMRRWPDDFKELQAFVAKQSRGRVLLKYYDNVSFEQITRGRVHVRCFRDSKLAMEYTLLSEAERQGRK